MTTRRAGQELPMFVGNVSHYLRDKHQLKRLQAEWLCFRFLGTILSMDMEEYPPIRIAERLFNLWKVPSLTREFELLFSGVLSSTNPPTDEQRECKPPNASNSGQMPVLPGIKGKSRRGN